jgi:hypothetical protein
MTIDFTEQLLTSKLADNAEAGSTRILLQPGLTLNPGDSLLIDPTGQSENAIVSSRNGPTITLVNPLAHNHRAGSHILNLAYFT